MHSILAGLLLVPAVVTVCWFSSRDGDGADLGLGLFLGAIVGAILGAIVGGYIGTKLPTSAQTDTYPLAAMRQYDGVSGVFVWGSGSVSTGQSYAVMTVQSDGSFKPWSTPAGADITIREMPELHNEGRMIIRYTKTDESSALASWGLYTKSYGYTYEFDVPAGSVVHQFKAN